MEAELFEPQRQQHRCEQRVAGHLAADRDRLAVRARGADDAVDQAQHRGMQRRIEFAQRIVVAVGGEQVLHEVVGADRQEIHGADEGLQRDRGRGHFDHRADRHGFGDGMTFGAQFALHVLDPGAHRDHFLASADHRDQHAHRAVGAGAQDRAQLRPEQRVAREGQAHAAQAHRRVRFAGERQCGAVGLVRADVERTDRHRAPGHAQHQVAIGAELLVFVGQAQARVGGTLHEQEFGAVQADAGRTERVRFGDVLA